MKTILRNLMLVAFAAAVTQTSFGHVPFNIPDAGASAVLVAIGAAGLVAARGIFRKK
jgi:hypothetical protein